jgi:hypothetical protein
MEEESPSNEFISYVIDSNEYAPDDDRAIEREFMEKLIPIFTSNKDFVFTLEDLAEILEVKEFHLHTTLLDNMQKGKDFKEEKGPVNKGKGGRPKINTLLTADCLKRFCAILAGQKGGSKKGKQILTYLLFMEKQHRESMM